MSWTYDAKLRRDVFPLPVGEAGGSIESDRLVDWLVERRNTERFVAHLDRYFGDPTEVGRIYSGQFFEHFSALSEGLQFTPYDILAVQSLGVAISSETCRWLLEPHQDRDWYLRAAQSEIGESTLWTCDPQLLSDGGSLALLYSSLRGQRGLGPVRTSKLLAVKFPTVVPIRDSKVETLLGWSRQENWWFPMRDLILSGEPPIFSIIEQLPLPRNAPEVTVLRKLDVVLWMEARSRDL